MRLISDVNAFYKVPRNATRIRSATSHDLRHPRPRTCFLSLFVPCFVCFVAHCDLAARGMGAFNAELGSHTQSHVSGRTNEKGLAL